jgi:hypothetical protein
MDPCLAWLVAALQGNYTALATVIACPVAGFDSQQQYLR